MSADANLDTLRVAIVEDMPQTRDALEFLINQAPDMTCVAGVASAEEALAKLPDLQPKVVLLDIELAGELSGADCIDALKAAMPQASIVMLTASQDAKTVFRCLTWGANGYLHKSVPPEYLPVSVREAAMGGAPMSPEIARLVTSFFMALRAPSQEWEKLSMREQEVLEQMTNGYVKKEIADRLNISEDTVRTHCKRIYEKLHVTCREHAVAKAIPLAALEWLKQEPCYRCGDDRSAETSKHTNRSHT